MKLRHLLFCLAACVLFLAPAATHAQSPPTIVAAEYYFDDNTNRVFSLPAADGAFDSPDESVSADIILPADLPLGPHMVNIRMKSSANVWSTTRSHLIVITGERLVTAAEYYIDTDPGPGKGKPMRSVDGVWRGLEEALEATEIPTDGLSGGLHTIYVRARDQDLQWGPSRSFTFEVVPTPVVASIEYLLSETNNPAGDWKPLVASAGSAFNSATVDAEASIDTSRLSQGVYKVWLRAKDQAGRVTGEVQSRQFQVTKDSPALEWIADRLLLPGNLLSFKVNAGKGVTGTFSLGAGAPAGMTIDAVSGLISYTPAAGATPASNRVTVIYTDGGTPAFRQESSFALTVDPASGGPIPTLVSALSLEGSGLVDLVFSRPLDEAVARSTASYAVNGTVPSSATLRPDGRSVVLAAGGLSGGTFTVNVKGLKDTLGKAMAPTNATGTVVAFKTADLADATAPAVPGGAFAQGAASFDLTSTGTGFLDRTDRGRFVYEEISGDFEVRVQVARLQTVDYLTSAGLMARDSLDPSAKTVGVLFRPQGNEPNGTNAIVGHRAIGFARSLTTGAGVVNGGSTIALVQPESWLRLERQGQTVRTFYGTDGTNWTQLSEPIIDLPGRLYVGMAAAAGNPTSGAAAFAEFRNYGSVKPAILTAPRDQSVAVGSEVVFGVTARGAGPLLYQWFFNGIPVAGETSSLLRLTGVTADRSGDYRVEVRNAFGLVASPVVKLSVGGTGAAGFEGDVFPRGTGDNAVTVSDWVQVGRFVVGLDTPSSLEFAKADCAPLRDGGNGSLDVADWAQTARFAIGLDATRPVVRAAEGGPRAGLVKMGLPEKPRTLTLASVRVRTTGIVELPVSLDCRGVENALGFSLSFNPQRTRFRGARLDGALTSGTLQANARGAGEGKVGILIGLPANVSMGRGSTRIAWVAFDLLDGATPSEIAFDDAPVRKELVDVDVGSLPLKLVDGAVIPISEGFAPAITPTASGELELSFASDPGRDYAIDWTTDFSRWETATRVRANGPVQRLTLPWTTSSRFYRVRSVE